MSQSRILLKTRQRHANRTLVVLFGLILTIGMISGGRRSHAENRLAQHVLKIEVTEYHDSGDDVAQLLFRVSEKFGVPIGIELSGQQPAQNISVRVSHGTVMDLVNGIVGQASGLEWAELNGVVNVMPRERPNSVLDLKVAHFHVRDASVADVRDAVAAIPEVKAWLAQSGVSERSFVSPDPTAQINGQPRVSLDLNGVSVREIMNTIVKAPGLHVWSFVRYGKDRQYLSIAIG
jgi:hypothetical protein